MDVGHQPGRPVQPPRHRAQEIRRIAHHACRDEAGQGHDAARGQPAFVLLAAMVVEDRKSTRLNSSHLVISYAVFCLKKKKSCRAATLPSVRSSLTSSITSPAVSSTKYEAFHLTLRSSTSSARMRLSCGCRASLAVRS